MMRYGYNMIKAAGLFASAYTKWRNKATVDKIWNTFIIFFTKHVKDYNKQQQKNQQYSLYYKFKKSCTPAANALAAADVMMIIDDALIANKRKGA